MGSKWMLTTSTSASSLICTIEQVPSSAYNSITDSRTCLDPGRFTGSSLRYILLGMEARRIDRTSKVTRRNCRGLSISFSAGFIGIPDRVMPRLIKVSSFDLPSQYKAVKDSIL